MTEQWQELKETIIEMRDNGGTCTQQEVCKFLANYMDNLEKQMQEPRWIPVSERLPENGHYYLWCSDMGQVQSDYYWNGFENGMKYGYNIVAWMSLPEPYREMIEQEPRTGKWLEKEVHGDNVGEWQSARCSVCGRYHTTPYMYYFSPYNYCPVCGARMINVPEINDGKMSTT